MAAPAWVDELLGGPQVAWPGMGVRTDDVPWPEPLVDVDPELLALRRRIAVEHPETVGWLTGTDAARTEVAELAGAPSFGDAAVGQRDDLCLLAPEPGWPLVAGAVLFPSYWRLADKLGGPLARVHGRVPGYPAEQVDRFLDRLRAGQVVRRRNLLLHPDGELHAPVPPAQLAPVEDWWLRSERQTLRLLPRSGAVLFTIRTDTAPLGSLPGEARRLVADAVERRPPAWADYSGVGALLPALLEHLRN